MDMSVLARAMMARRWLDVNVVLSSQWRRAVNILETGKKSDKRKEERASEWVVFIDVLLR